MSAHSRIGPSRSALIMNCPGSVQAEDAAGRPPAGEAAKRGSELHAEAERLLRGGMPRGALFSLHKEPPEVATYVTAVRSIAARADVVPQIEVWLDCSRYHREMTGTADCILIDIAWGVLIVIDFKSGLIQIDPGSLQLVLYAAMSFLSLSIADQRKIKWIDTVIVQPTNGAADPVRRVRHRVVDVIDTFSRYIEQAHIATDDLNPPLTAGPWCTAHFCAARGSCSAFRALRQVEAREEFTVVETADGGARS